MDIVRFDKASLENALARLTDSALDDLAFGAVKLDSHGNILKYNAAEGEITGRNPEEVIGKNFFTEVAPCTNSPQFFGEFQKGVKAGKLSALFRYTFDYRRTPLR